MSFNLLLIVPYPPPNDIQLVEANPNQLTFQWSPVLSDCNAIQYHVIASGCGVCPIATKLTTVLCTEISKDGHKCTFAVQTVACNNVTGNRSKTNTVLLQGVTDYNSAKL